MTGYRKSIRLKEYDYSTIGAYFVTVCTYKRKWLFGDVINGKMRTNEYGDIANKCWQELPVHFIHVLLDKMVIMHNHFDQSCVFPYTVAMMKPIPELLSPVGDFISLHAAIQAGCDAIYFGIGILNMCAKKGSNVFAFKDLAKIRKKLIYNGKRRMVIGARFMILIVALVLVQQSLVRPAVAEDKPLSAVDKLIQQASEQILAHPKSFKAYVRRAYLYRETGRFQAALWDYNRAIEINPENAAAYVGRSGMRRCVVQDLAIYDDPVQVAYKQKEKQKVLSDLERALELQPDYALAYNARGAFFHQQGLPEKAEADFQKAISLEPNSPGGYNNLGVLYLYTGKQQQGLELLKKASRMSPRNVLISCNLGKAYCAIGELGLAEQCYDHILEIYPAHIAARHHRALIRHIQKRYAEAEADYKRLVEIAPDYAAGREAFRRLQRKQPADDLGVPDNFKYMNWP